MLKREVSNRFMINAVLLDCEVSFVDTSGFGDVYDQINTWLS